MLNLPAVNLDTAMNWQGWTVKRHVEEMTDARKFARELWELDGERDMVWMYLLTAEVMKNELKEFFAEKLAR